MQVKSKYATRSSEERVEEALARIESIDRNGYRLNSVIAISENAREQARAFDRAGIELPLGGEPILIKDNIEAIGLPASAGSLALMGEPMTRDATLVTRLREAGAIIIGATNLSEWANIRSTKSTSGWSGVGGLTANPWIHQRSAGGSSSGSGAAVAAGLTRWAIGSETDGSIICPASLNGTVGIKPSGGSIPAHGVIPISRSKDVPGPMSQTVAQCAELLAILLQRPELRDSGILADLSRANSLRFARVKSWMTPHEQTNALLEDALRKISRLSISIHEVDIPEPSESDSTDEFEVLLHELRDDLADYLLTRPNSPIKSLQEVIDFNERNRERELRHFHQDLFSKAIELQGKNGDYAIKFKRNLAWAQGVLDKGFADADILIGCSYAPAWTSNLEMGDSNIEASWITMAPAIAGYPIGTVPMGIADGLPVGIGVVAKKGREDQLISAMAMIERVLGLGILKPTFINC